MEKVEIACTSASFINFEIIFSVKSAEPKSASDYLVSLFIFCIIFMCIRIKTHDQFRSCMHEVNAKLDRILAVIQPPK